MIQPKNYHKISFAMIFAYMENLNEQLQQVT